MVEEPSILQQNYIFFNKKREFNQYFPMLLSFCKCEA